MGQGGFGITYRAEHVLLGKTVAIKEFFPKEYCERDGVTGAVSAGTSNTADTVAKLRAKFLKEARNIAKLDHPGIVRVHDIFEENGTAYYVMDYIEGGSLSDCGVMSVQEALDVVRKVGAALGYLHSRSMNHLDIKPANIMMRPDDNFPVLIDFGLAKQYDDSGEQTSTGILGISQGYAPPEQYLPGGVSHFTPRTDIYALGATLYRLLTGKTPPASITHPFPNLDYPATVPVSVRKAIKRAMSQSAADRYPTAAAFLADLDCTATTDKKKKTTISHKEETAAITDGPVVVKPRLGFSLRSLTRRQWIYIALSVVAAFLLGLFMLKCGTYYCAWLTDMESNYFYDFYFTGFCCGLLLISLILFLRRKNAKTLAFLCFAAPVTIFSLATIRAADRYSVFYNSDIYGIYGIDYTPESKALYDKYGNHICSYPNMIVTDKYLVGVGDYPYSPAYRIIYPLDKKSFPIEDTTTNYYINLTDNPEQDRIKFEEDYGEIIFITGMMVWKELFRDWYDNVAVPAEVPVAEQESAK